MKIKITMKDPDTMHDAVNNALQSDIKKMELPDDEAESLMDIRFEKTLNIMSTWFKNGEYLTVEVDTESMTARVVPITEMK